LLEWTPRPLASAKFVDVEAFRNQEFHDSYLASTCGEVQGLGVWGLECGERDMRKEEGEGAGVVGVEAG
jgi:hypothetical protein